MSKTTIQWKVGDRVYLVGDERLTGTVVHTAGGGIVETLAGKMFESKRFCRVHWDGSATTDASWYADADLECYTRPAVDEYDTRTWRESIGWRNLSEVA